MKKSFFTSDNECSPVSHVLDSTVENVLLLCNVTALILTKGTALPLTGSSSFTEDGHFCQNDKERRSRKA